MADEEVAPSRREVLSYLERILATPRFRNAAIQSQILRFVTESALASTPITEVDIATEVPSNFNADSHKVRSNCSIVRGKIKQYYELDGKEDLVAIDFPPGPAYRPTFAYNTDAAAVRAYKRGIAYQGMATLEGLRHSTYSFLEAQGFDPGFTPTYTAMAETILLEYVMDQALDLSPRGVQMGPGLMADLQSAFALDPQSWRAHLLAGAQQLICCDWAAASNAFGLALKIDSVRTRASLWYAAFLVTVGDVDEGLAICTAHIADYPEDRGAHLVTAFFLYAARKPEEAHTCLANGFRFDWKGDLQNLLIALIFTETGTNEFGRVMLIRVSKERWSYDEAYVDRHPGLMMLCLARAGNVNSLQERLGVLRQEKRRKPMQLVFAYLATGNQARALCSLARAQKQKDILINWLHMMPVFDSLREHPRFVRFLEQRKKHQAQCRTD